MFDTPHVSKNLLEQAAALRKFPDMDLPSETILGTFVDAAARTTTVKLLDFPDGDCCLALCQVLPAGTPIREIRVRADALPKLARAIEEARRLAPPVLKGAR